MHLIKSIYSEVEVNENKMKHVNNNIKVKLNDQEKQSIEGCLPEYECSTAIKEMKYNKSRVRLPTLYWWCPCLSFG